MSGAHALLYEIYIGLLLRFPQSFKDARNCLLSFLV